MTATPHNGHEEDFQAWLALVDADRFHGKARDKAQPTDIAVHFDQFLHAYYYPYVRAGVGADEDDELSGLEKVEAFFIKHRGNRAAALKEAAQWWASLPADRYFAQSTLGEAVGWARPDDFPPRNNRTNKALRSLGHDVKLFSKA